MSSSDADLRQAAAKVRKTRDVIDPAARAQNDALEKKSLVRTLIGASVFLGISNIVTAVAALLALWFALHVQPVYFAAESGRFSPLVPLGVPYVKQSDVIKFAKEAIEASNTLDFTNYRSQMEAVRSRYTTEGFSAYATGMDTNGTLPLIKGKRMNLTSSTGTGVLVEEGEQEGVYQWVVKFPLSLKLVGQATEMPEQKLYAMVRVTRISTLENIQGLGVMSVVTKPQ